MRLFSLTALAAGLLTAAAPGTSAAPAPASADGAAAVDLKLTPIAAGEGRAIATKLADDLIASFVFRDNAEDYAAMLRKNAAAGRYDTGTRGDVATLMTEDLLAVHKDGHLRVFVADGAQGRRERGGDDGPPKGWPPLIQAAKMIAPGVAYIRFTAFWGTPDELAGVRKWLAENRGAKTLIFDLRNHHGGGLDEQDVIFSYLYGQKTPLLRMAIAKHLYDAGRSPLEPGPTLAFAAEGDKMVGTHSAVPGEATALRNAQALVLVSNKSASAAEHFALALKTTGRATLIGEATAGANHFGGGQPLNENFAVWMPIGRTYDIKTGKDWEGAGIAPDIAVDPKQALVLALEKAGLSHADAVRLDAQEVPAEPVHRDKLRAR